MSTSRTRIRAGVPSIAARGSGGGQRGRQGGGRSRWPAARGRVRRRHEAYLAPDCAARRQFRSAPQSAQRGRSACGDGQRRSHDSQWPATGRPAFAASKPGGHSAGGNDRRRRGVEASVAARVRAAAADFARGARSSGGRKAARGAVRAAASPAASRALPDSRSLTDDKTRAA